MNQIVPFVEFNIKYHPELEKVINEYKFEVDVDYLLERGARQLENGFIQIDVQWKSNKMITVPYCSCKSYECCCKAYDLQFECLSAYSKSFNRDINFCITVGIQLVNDKDMEADGPYDRLDYVPIFHQCNGLDGALVYFAPSDWNDTSKARVLPFLPK